MKSFNWVKKYKFLNWFFFEMSNWLKEELLPKPNDNLLIELKIFVLLSLQTKLLNNFYYII